MTTAAIILAAGSGSRAGGDQPKQWRPLAGRPVAAHALAAFRRAPGIDLLVLVHPPGDVEAAASIAPPGEDVRLVAGGATRDASVRAALEALEDSGVSLVLIHDGARPLVSTALIARVLGALGESDAAAPGLPVTDALWRGADGRVAEIVDRDGLFAAQTPQGFRLDAILAAHRAHGAGSADDVEVARRAGLSVAIVEGEADNIKITRPADFDRARRTLGGMMDIRTGTGFDVHAFGPGDHVILCGVAVPHDFGLEGHSDADVAMHALTDAIYGAMGDGDIGRHFPPTDPAFRGVASETFLADAMARARARGYRLGNADLTLICERPKITPHAGRMVARLAEILGAAPDRLSVKATTSERLGFTGREEGIAALASVTLVSP
jgi:2-C-methyl-D-erythritol 4-phosphate cytidylyltransferase / 2-C-methyl-D-erythritol 2,4-cyclodiphosphate synthase